VAQSPTPNDEIVRQMELLKDVDPDEVGIPEAKLAEQAQAAADREGTSILSPEQAPELFSASNKGSLFEVVRLLEDLPMRIAEELKRG
jgi:hypothetical protein